MMLELDKFETCQKESGLLEDGISRDVYQPSEQHGDKKKRQDNNFIWSKNTDRLD